MSCVQYDISKVTLTIESKVGNRKKTINKMTACRAYMARGTNSCMNVFE